MAEFNTSTEGLLDSGVPKIIDIDGRPTSSIIDSIRIARAVGEDVPSIEGEVFIQRYLYVPTEDLTAGIESHLFAGLGSPEHWDGLDYGRAIGLQVLEEFAKNQGFSDYSNFHRSKSEEMSPDDITPRNDDPSYFGLYDGGPIFDLEKGRTEDGDPVTWVSLVESYGGENDDVVNEYFDNLNRLLRVDTALHFRNLSPYVRLMFETDEEAAQTILDVINALATYLAERGYESEDSGIVLFEVKK